MDLTVAGHQAGWDGISGTCILPRARAVAPAAGRDVVLGCSAFGVERAGDRDSRTQVQVEVVDAADQSGFAFVHDQLAIDDVVAKWRRTARPCAFAAGGRHLVSRAFADHFALKLCEGHQHVERQAADGVGGGEVLGHAHECGAGAVEAVHYPGEVEQRAAQAVDFVDDHHVDLAGLHVLHEALEGWAFKVRAGEAAVGTLLGDELPAEPCLASDILLAGFALGIQGVEVLIESRGGGLACVDRAALGFRARRRGRRLSSLCHARASVVWVAPGRRWSPKNVYPFQGVPLISRAICDRLVWRWPWYSKPSARTVT